MSDEEFFQTALDSDEEDHPARLLFADWLADRGDTRSAGPRWLVERRVVPQDYRGSRTWDWNDDAVFDRMTGALPHALFSALEGGHLAMSEHYREYPTRRDAESALYDALARHPRLLSLRTSHQPRSRPTADEDPTASA